MTPATCIIYDGGGEGGLQFCRMIASSTYQSRMPVHAVVAILTPYTPCLPRPVIQRHRIVCRDTTRSVNKRHTTLSGHTAETHHSCRQRRCVHPRGMWSPWRLRAGSAPHAPASLCGRPAQTSATSCALCVFESRYTRGWLAIRPVGLTVGTTGT